MDSAKGTVAAMTMVRGEDFFLERWIAYYRQYLPANQIYVINHGGLPEVADIARDVNVINLPYDETKKAVNQRRWNILSNHGSALTQFYNWVICGDVDEFVIVDPDVSENLCDYLMTKDGADRVPALICFALEMVHVPELEPSPIVDGEKILAKRGVYRLNSNYAKPCVLSQPITFSAGGHAGTQRKLVIDPHLYNIHMRFVDYDMCMARLDKGLQRRLSGKSEEEQARLKASKWGWNSAAKTFDALSKRHPVATTVDHPEFRERMLSHPIKKGRLTYMGGGRPKEQYQLPDRFRDLV
ncbi:MAG: glycosyltransferase family 2 protein [Pseudomonadota bacterium]